MVLVCHPIVALLSVLPVLPWAPAKPLAPPPLTRAMAQQAEQAGW
jgi:hypothetical protein